MVLFYFLLTFLEFNTSSSEGIVSFKLDNSFSASFTTTHATFPSTSSICSCTLSTYKIIFDVKKRKKYNYKNSDIECVVKDVKIYLYTLKNELFGCFRIEENVTKTMKQV